MNKLFVAYYSQTGQLKEIISNFITPWKKDFIIDSVEIICDKFGFPVTYKQFFDVFPETVLKIPWLL
ncbi:MAG: hypothetical protein LBG15_03140 [Dysgonamonadaceae bacterium]|jgi:hypothetical protein|nr:hypothetical protein [Dysgonamonadaceae bacterium]